MLVSLHVTNCSISFRRATIGGMRIACRLTLSAFVCIVALAGCSKPKELRASGEIWHYPHPFLSSFVGAADGVQGLVPKVFDGEKPAVADIAGPDASRTVLVWGEWNYEWLDRARDGIWLDPSPTLDGTLYGSTLPRNAPLIEETGGGRFLPTHVSYVGLFHRADSRLGSSDAWSWIEFEASLEQARSAGLHPIAIGAAFTSPALAWFGMLDMRFNGSAEYKSFLDGERKISDKSFDVVFATLEAWREKGYFHPQSSTWSWVQALQAVLDGQATCTLLSASSATRVPPGTDIAFLRLPDDGDEDTGGEIAQVYGYSIAGDVAGLESALAWVQSVSQVDVGNRGIEPLSAETRSEEFPDQKAFFESDEPILPPLEVGLRAQDSYDIGLSFSQFLRDESYTASDLRDQIGRFLSR